MDSTKRVIEIDGEKIHLQKSNYGFKLLDYWRVVSPVKDENGKFNWFNLLLGGYSNLLFMLMAILFFVLLAIGFNEMFSGCQAIANNPCLYCNTILP